MLNDFQFYEGISACLIMRLFFFRWLYFFFALFSCHKSQTCRLLLDVFSQKKSDRKFVILRCSFFLICSFHHVYFHVYFLLQIPSGVFLFLFLHKIRSQKMFQTYSLLRVYAFCMCTPDKKKNNCNCIKGKRVFIIWFVFQSQGELMCVRESQSLRVHNF